MSVQLFLRRHFGSSPPAVQTRSKRSGTTTVWLASASRRAGGGPGDHEIGGCVGVGMGVGRVFRKFYRLMPLPTHPHPMCQMACAS